MFNDSLLQLSLSDLKELLIDDMSLLNITQTYIIVYVIYKALGRYVYFKPEEHASKINRTFLFISTYIIVVHFFSKLILWPISIPSEYKWLYTLSTLVLITGLFSMVFKRIIYDHKSHHSRYWTNDFLPISTESYKTSTTRSEVRGNYTNNWNEETIAYTDENLHSDMMLNFIALIIFVVTNISWIINIQGASETFFAIICTISITAIFINQGLYKWMHFVRKKLQKN